MTAASKLRDLTAEERNDMLDLRSAEIVGIQVSPAPNGSLTVWVCVNGACRFRITHVEHVELTDDRGHRE